jgi:hypothetical protein
MRKLTLLALLGSGCMGNYVTVPVQTSDGIIQMACFDESSYFDSSSDEAYSIYDPTETGLSVVVQYNSGLEKNVLSVSKLHPFTVTDENALLAIRNCQGLNNPTLETIQDPLEVEFYCY